MDRPARNKKAVDYSQFLDLENDDEDFASSVPVSKKSRIEPKREKKDNVPKKPKDETLLPKEVTLSPKNSQSKRLPLDDKIYQRDLEVALALSVQETSVIIENDENTPRNVSPAFFPSEIKDPEVSFSNCSVDSSILGLDEITENKEETVNGRSRRQAASKAITEQRKLLKDDSGGEEDAEEFRPDSAVYEDSDSDESYSGDDEEFEVKKSKKAGASQIPKAKKENKVKNTPRARRKGENDSSVSEDEEFDIKKSKKSAGSKCAKAKSGKKESNVPLSKAASVSSPAPLTIKIKPLPAKPTTASSPGSAIPNGHGSRPVGMKRPAWSPPASSGSVGSPVTGLNVRSPNQGLRLGLSRLARVKPLHPASVPQ